MKSNKPSTYKQTMSEFHQLPPSNLMEDVNTDGFQQFVAALEADPTKELTDADQFFKN